jgi:hypothetical protein
MLEWPKKHDILPELIAIGIVIVLVTAPWTVYWAICGPTMAVEKYREWAKKQTEENEETVETGKEGEKEKGAGVGVTETMLVV